jgi:hypothetical protein
MGLARGSRSLLEKQRVVMENLPARLRLSRRLRGYTPRKDNLVRRGRMALQSHRKARISRERIWKLYQPRLLKDRRRCSTRRSWYLMRAPEHLSRNNESRPRTHHHHQLLLRLPSFLQAPTTPTPGALFQACLSHRKQRHSRLLMPVRNLPLCSPLHVVRLVRRR